MNDDDKQKTIDLLKENEQLQEYTSEQERRKFACIETAHLLKLENEKLKQENEQLKKQFIQIIESLGKKNPQCHFCEFGKFYTFSSNHGKDIEHLFVCKKGHGDRVRRDYCSDWKITAERNREE